MTLDEIATALDDLLISWNDRARERPEERVARLRDRILASLWNNGLYPGAGIDDEYTRARLIGIAQRALTDDLGTFFDAHADAETLLSASAAVVDAILAVILAAPTLEPRDE